jgi:UDP-glucose 4-epimerase
METTDIRHLVFSSSCTVYGSCQAQEVFEQTPWARAFSPYGYSKQVCERMMEDFALVKNECKLVSLRYFNPIGAHPSGMLGELPIGAPNNVVPYITQTAAGIRERLTIFGDDYDTPDGTCIRDYIHVMDVARAHVKALEYILRERAPAIDQFNIGTGDGVSVKELVHFFESTTGVKVTHVIGPRRAGDADAIYANVGKAKRILEWKSQYSVQEALGHSWLWQQNLKT